MVPRRLLFVSLFLALFTLLISAQRSGSSAQTKHEGSIYIATFPTRLGTIRVSLPGDMAAGDTISGTVIAEPSGKTDKEKQRNAGELNGYVIELENQKSPVSGGVMRRVALAPTTLAPSLILLDAKGKQIAVMPIAVQPSSTPAPKTFDLPTLGQAGRPIEIIGPFDGDSSNTNVKLGDTPAKVLAESPRKLVVASPSNVVGPTEIKVTENGTTTTGPFRNLKIDLTAPKTSLLKGESTELRVEVNGLEGLTQPVQVQLQNQSPSTVNLHGGNTQSIVIQPSQVQTGGTFSSSGQVTGTGNGPFIITATLPPGFNFGAIPSTSPTTSRPTATPTPTPASMPPPTGPSQTKATASPSPSMATAQRTSPQVFPTPTTEERFNNSYTKQDTDCCKKFLNQDGAFEILDDKGNSFKIFRNKLTMKIDGQEYEWEFTQDGKPFYIEWMFCHLNDHMIISQLSQVMVQRVKGGNTSESANTTSVSLHGPYRDEHSRRPSYGFQFGAQKLGTDVKEYGVSFSMDAEFCAWSCQLIAEGKVLEFRTNPARSPNAIFNGLNQSVGLPTGATAYQQQAWWNAMYSYFFEIEDWLLWIDGKESGDLTDTIQNYNLWRTKLNSALEQMLKTAAEEDKSLITQMQGLLENEHPSPEQIKQIGQQFDKLHLRYGTKVPADVRKELLRQP
jgi:hypothetical protein